MHFVCVFAFTGFGCVASAVSRDGVERSHPIDMAHVFATALLFGLPCAARGAQPIINVRLAPPERSLPQIVSEIELLEGARAKLEDEQRRAVGEAFAAATDALKHRIDNVVGSAFGASGARPGKPVQATSMLSSDADGRREEHVADMDALLVKVFPVPAPDAAIGDKIAAIDKKQVRAEAHLFKQAAAEMKALVDIFVDEVDQQLKLHIRSTRSGKVGAAGFLQARRGLHSDADVGSASPQLDVRVGASDVPFPTIEGLVQQMEDGRASSEESVRQHILGLELQLLQAGNAMLEDRLRASLGIAKM